MLGKLTVLFLFLILLGGKSFSLIQVGPVFVIDVFLALAGSIVVIQTLAKGRLPVVPGHGAVLVFVLLYVTYGSILLLSSASNSSILKLRDFVIFLYALCAWILPSLLSYSDLKNLVRLLFVACVINTCFGLGNYFAGFVYVHEGRYIPGQIGIYILLSLIFSGSFLLSNVTVVPRGILGVLCAVSGLGLLMTAHRIYLVVALLGAAFVYVSMLRLRIIKGRFYQAVVLLLAAVLFAAVLVFLLPAVYERLGTIFDPNSASALFRSAAFELAMQKWNSNMLFGEGLGFDFSFYATGSFFEDVRPHNIMLTLLVKGGVLAAILFALIIASSIRAYYLLFQFQVSEEKEIIVFAIAALACLLSLIMVGLGNLLIESPFLAIFFWLFVGLPVSLGRRS